MRQTGWWDPKKSRICNGKHFSISLAVNRKIYWNECKRKNNCLLFGWHNCNNLHTVWTNECHAMHCMKKNTFPIYIHEYNGKQKEYFQTELHNCTTNHKFWTRKYVLNEMEFKRHKYSIYKSSVFFFSFTIYFLLVKQKSQAIERIARILM